MSLFAAAALLLTPLHGAETLPEDTLMLHIDGGLSLFDIDLPSVPSAYAMTGELGVAYGLSPGLDLRARYTTTLGLIHRLGPELRARFLSGDELSGALRLHPSVQFAGAHEEGLDYGGDVSTLGALLLTHRIFHGAVTAQAGATVQWLLFEDLRGERFVDDKPYVAYLELGLGYEWATSDSSTLALRLEASVPTAPDDPFTVLGTLPRALFGGSWSL